MISNRLIDQRLHEPTHTYTINGDSNYTSVTTWNHSHFEHFDADKIIKNMMNSSKWINNKYYGKTPDEIKQIWDNKIYEKMPTSILYLQSDFFFNYREAATSYYYYYLS